MFDVGEGFAEIVGKVFRRGVCCHAHRLVVVPDYKLHIILVGTFAKDNTSGCTKQACAFSELFPHFREKGAEIIGISKDSVASHKKFQEKFNLNFTLLADTEKTAIQAYDVWKEKTLYGKKSFGVVRTTYLIDENGIITKAFSNVKAAENPGQMLEEI